MFDINVGVQGFFGFEVYNEKGEISQSSGLFQNTILTSGLLSLATTNLKSMMTYVNIGSSSVAPNASQTGLLNRLFTTSTLFNSTSEAVSGSDENWRAYVGWKRIFQFAVGTCVGDFTEVGVSSGNNTGYLNRQLFKDDGGNPIIVRVTADEGLRLTCEIRMYLDASLFRQTSEVYVLDTKGATAGSIVFSNGTLTKSITLANLTTGGQFDTFGVDCMANAVKSAADGLITYQAHWFNAASLNLSIQSHTLTGGTGEPTLTNVLPFQQVKTACNFEWQDLTTGTPTTVTALQTIFRRAGSTIPSHLTLKRSSTAEQYMGWGYYAGGAYWVDNLYFSTLQISAIRTATTITSPSTTTTLSSPTSSDISYVKRFKWTAGTLGSGNQQIYGLIANQATTTNVISFFVILFDSPLTLLDVEEFYFDIKISWGQYTP